MSRKNSPNKNPRSVFKPENHFDRIILSYAWKSEESLVNFERYTHECGAIFNPIFDRPYVVIKRSTELSFRKRALEHEISDVHQVIPPLDQKDVDALRPKLLPVTDQLVFEWSEEGWPYVYFCNDDCLYVGETAHYPVHRATEHLDNPGRSDWGKYLKSHRHDHQGWYIRWIRLSDCETLIRKSLILPSEDTDAHMQQIEEEFQERNRIHPKWWRKDAERVLIRAFHSRYNTSGNRSQDRE